MTRQIQSVLIKNISETVVVSRGAEGTEARWTAYDAAELIGRVMEGELVIEPAHLEDDRGQRYTLHLTSDNQGPWTEPRAHVLANTSVEVVVPPGMIVRVKNCPDVRSS
jgi:hypothetical protein